jgi:hypothetical protein
LKLTPRLGTRTHLFDRRRWHLREHPRGAQCFGGVEAVAGAAREVVAVPAVQPRHTRPATPAGGSVHHPQRTEGPATVVRRGGRSSALRTEWCASTSRPDKAPHRNRPERSATPYRRRGSSRPACWACAGRQQGRRKPLQPTVPPLRRTPALRVGGAQSTPSSHAALGCVPHCARGHTGIPFIGRFTRSPYAGKEYRSRVAVREHFVADVSCVRH